MDRALIMMVGLPASGKSTLAKQYADNSGFIIHSSDDLRKELYGDSSIQGDNAKLFAELHKRIFADMNNNKNIIYDATNLNYKLRRNFLSLVGNKFSDYYKVAFVIATSFEDCVKNDLQRKNQVGINVISRMRKSFFMPNYREGFDFIKIFKNSDITKDYVLEKFNMMREFQQDNPHHKLTLDKHCLNVEHIFIRKLQEGLLDYPLNYTNFDYVKYVHIGYLHDIGKLWTKTFKDSKGNDKEFASYYGHENVSSYEYMIIAPPYKTDEYIIHNCNLIQYHMIPFNITEKSAKKWKEFLGERMFKELILLHEADLEGKE